MKLKVVAAAALTSFAEQGSLQYVLAQAYEPLSKQKAPKAQADALAWIESSLLDFGIAGLGLRDLIEFLKTGLKSSNASVRAAATKTIVVLKLFAGGEIRGFLDDLNSQLLSTIEGEFAKIDGREAPAATRQQKDIALPQAGSGVSMQDQDNLLDELCPRVNLDHLVMQTTVIKDSRSENWKVRKESLVSLKILLEVKANARLTPNMGMSNEIIHLNPHRLQARSPMCSDRGSLTRISLSR